VSRKTHVIFQETILVTRTGVLCYQLMVPHFLRWKTQGLDDRPESMSSLLHKTPSETLLQETEHRNSYVASYTGSCFFESTFHKVEGDLVCQ